MGLCSPFFRSCFAFAWVGCTAVPCGFDSGGEGREAEGQALKDRSSLPPPWLSHPRSPAPSSNRNLHQRSRKLSTRSTTLSSSANSSYALSLPPSCHLCSLLPSSHRTLPKPSLRLKPAQRRIVERIEKPKPKPLPSLPPPTLPSTFGSASRSPNSVALSVPSQLLYSLCNLRLHLRLTGP